MLSVHLELRLQFGALLKPCHTAVSVLWLAQGWSGCDCKKKSKKTSKGPMKLKSLCSQSRHTEKENKIIITNKYLVLILSRLQVLKFGARCFDENVCYTCVCDIGWLCSMLRNDRYKHRCCLRRKSAVQSADIETSAERKGFAYCCINRVALSSLQLSLIAQTYSFYL